MNVQLPLVPFAKSRKDVEKSAKEIVNLANKAKPIKDAVAKAKIFEPQKKWDEYMDELIKSLAKLGELTAKSADVYDDAKNAVKVVKKACDDCHTDFRVNETSS